MRRAMVGGASQPLSDVGGGSRGWGHLPLRSQRAGQSGPPPPRGGGGCDHPATVWLGPASRRGHGGPRAPPLPAARCPPPSSAPEPPALPFSPVPGRSLQDRVFFCHWDKAVLIVGVCCPSQVSGPSLWDGARKINWSAYTITTAAITTAAQRAVRVGVKM